MCQTLLYLITPVEILNFIKANERCIIKPICHGLQISKEGAFSIYTSEITDLSIFEKSEIFECPAFIQRKVENFRDIRATVIGNKIFAVEIEKECPDDVDWRYPDIKKTYNVHKLPHSLQNLMFKLHKKLIYSAFDFILTPSGEYYFLETNPAGEWVWLERELGLPISTAIINELIET